MFPSRWQRDCHLEALPVGPQTENTLLVLLKDKYTAFHPPWQSISVSVYGKKISFVIKLSFTNIHYPMPPFELRHYERGIWYLPQVALWSNTIAVALTGYLKK